MQENVFVLVYASLARAAQLRSGLARAAAVGEQDHHDDRGDDPELREPSAPHRSNHRSLPSACLLAPLLARHGSRATIRVGFG
jgi:hypothetical protein